MKRSFAKILLLGLLVLAATLGFRRALPLNQIEPPAPVPAVQESLEVTGELVPHRSLNLSFPSSAQVAQVLVKEGNSVRAGQVLARLGNLASLQAQSTAAELELLLARQALQDLRQNAVLELAQAEEELAQARRQQSLAAAKVQHIKDRPSQLQIDQAYANMQLAENQLEQARQDLQRAEKKWNNRKSRIWLFLSRHEFKQTLEYLNKVVALKAQRLDVAREKYQDLSEPLDEIDLAIAEGDLAVAQANLDHAYQRRDELTSGPDPDKLAAAQARIQSAQAALEAARRALQDAELLAPMDAKVVQVNVKPDQWMPAGQTAVVLADTSSWVVETSDLTEKQVPEVQVGQRVQLAVQALPDLPLTGVVASIDGLYEFRGGDVFYTVHIPLDQNDPRLRWGMSADVTFEPQK
jgi:multidrug efflux pump subunit AcrA (membrane-fusion protein)